MNNIIIFEQANQPVEVRLEGETVWLSQAQMAELFDTSTDNISLHLKNIYRDGELEESATTEDFSVVRQEGARQVRRKLKHYNLDAISPSAIASAPRGPRAFANGPPAYCASILLRATHSTSNASRSVASSSSRRLRCCRARCRTSNW